MRKSARKSGGSLQSLSRREKAQLELQDATKGLEARPLQFDGKKISAVRSLNPMTRKLVSAAMFPLLTILRLLSAIGGATRSAKEIGSPKIYSATARKIDQRGGARPRLIENRGEREKE